MHSDSDFREKVISGQWKRPTHPEKFVLEAINSSQLPITYVGNGKLWIGSRSSGIRNPDFVVNGQPKVIEVYNPGFPPGRNDGAYVYEAMYFYERHGYKCLCLELADYSRRWCASEIATNLRNFVSNGLTVSKIKGVRKKKGINVYNFRCSPHPTYLVNSILTHNCINEHTLEHLDTLEDVEVAVNECVRVADIAIFIAPSPYNISNLGNPKHPLRLWFDQVNNKIRVEKNPYRLPIGQVMVSEDNAPRIEKIGNGFIIT